MTHWLTYSSDTSGVPSRESAGADPSSNPSSHSPSSSPTGHRAPSRHDDAPIHGPADHSDARRRRRLATIARARARGPGRTHQPHPEQRAGLGRVPQATVVAVRPVRERAPGARVHRAARRQVREANRAHRPGPGRTSRGAPAPAADQGLFVRPAAAAAGERRRLPAAAAAAAAVSVVAATSNTRSWVPGRATVMCRRHLI